MIYKYITNTSWLKIQKTTAYGSLFDKSQAINGCILLSSDEKNDYSDFTGLMTNVKS